MAKTRLRTDIFEANAYRSAPEIEVTISDKDIAVQIGECLRDKGIEALERNEDEKGVELLLAYMELVKFSKMEPVIPEIRIEEED